MNDIPDLAAHLDAINARWHGLDSDAHRARVRDEYVAAGWKACTHAACPPWDCRRSNPPTMDPVGALLYEEPQRRQNIMWQLHLMTLEPPERWGKAVRVAVYKTSDSASSTVQRLRGQTKLPPGRWKFEQAVLDDGEGTGVYARYLGPGDKENER